MLLCYTGEFYGTSAGDSPGVNGQGGHLYQNLLLPTDWRGHPGQLRWAQKHWGIERGLCH